MTPEQANWGGSSGPSTLTMPKADISALTGYVRASAQVRWLKHNGWKFAVNALGDPIVAVSEFNRHMVGGKGAASVQEPNWDWMKINGGSKKKSAVPTAVKAPGPAQRAVDANVSPHARR